MRRYKPRKKRESFKPIRTTGIGLHPDLNKVAPLGETGLTHTSARAVGPDHTTRWKTASRKTLTELLCSGVVKPSIIITLVVEHEVRDITSCVTEHMLRQGAEAPEIYVVLTKIYNELQAMKR